MLILLVFLLAFGVAAAAILKSQQPSWNMVSDIVFHPYFNIYGELFMDRSPENSKC